MSIFALLREMLTAPWVRALRFIQRKQDAELIEYLLMREFVVCPRCRSAFRVTRLEEQFNTTWQCEVCHCRFQEFPQHTATEEEL